MSNGLDNLPDDPAELKRLLLESQRLLQERQAQIDQIKREAAERMEAMEQRHKAEMDAIIRRFYGPHSEKFDPTELLLFGVNVAETIPVDAKVVEAESGEKLKSRRINSGGDKHGRRKLPDHLPRIEIPHDLNPEEKKCPCCGKDRTCIGSEVSEQLEFIPASFKVLKNIRHKYACKACDAAGNGAQIQIATKTPQPIEKGLPGPGLLANVIVSKLGDHLPLYRLEKIFDRHGVDIARSTMCAWMLAASALVNPLVQLMISRVKESRVIHTDDTRVPVQDETVKGKCKSGRIWTYIGDDANPYVVYTYTPDRTRAGPHDFLADFKGYLQADAYGGYDGVYKCGYVHEVACWAHARRKFFDAKTTDGRLAAQMLAMVARLYAVEDEASGKIPRDAVPGPGAVAGKALDYDGRRELRQRKSVPILAEIKTWLDAETQTVLPRSPMGQAIGYMLNQWEALNRYTEQGWLNIDNNAAERALKRVALGRKNWLFAGHDEAGASHARLYTLIASAERHGVDPQRYLTSVLAKIGNTPVSRLEQFLPDVWKRESQAELNPPAPIP